MDMFDRKSGKFIDFLSQGYCENIFGNDVNIERRYHPNAYGKMVLL